MPYGMIQSGFRWCFVLSFFFKKGIAFDVLNISKENNTSHARKPLLVSSSQPKSNRALQGTKQKEHWVSNPQDLDSKASTGLSLVDDID